MHRKARQVFSHLRQNLEFNIVSTYLFFNLIYICTIYLMKLFFQKDLVMLMLIITIFYVKLCDIAKNSA